MALFTLDVVMFLLFSDVTDHSVTKGKTRGTGQTKDSTQGTGQTQGSTQGTGQTKKSRKGTGHTKKSKQSTGQTKNRTLEADGPVCTTQDPVLTETNEKEPSFDSGMNGEPFSSQLDGEGHITAVGHQGSTSLASVSSVIQSASTLGRTRGTGQTKDSTQG